MEKGAPSRRKNSVRGVRSWRKRIRDEDYSGRKSMEVNIREEKKRDQSKDRKTAGEQSTGTDTNKNSKHLQSSTGSLSDFIYKSLFDGLTSGNHQFLRRAVANTHSTNVEIDKNTPSSSYIDFLSTVKIDGHF